MQLAELEALPSNEQKELLIVFINATMKEKAKEMLEHIESCDECFTLCVHKLACFMLSTREEVN